MTQSPEVFLTNPTWKCIYDSTWFKNRLILKVIDEAHMIYAWGLVKSGESKQLMSFKREQDRGAFRPSWGELYEQLMKTSRTPLLLMSATCPDAHLKKIINNLGIKRNQLTLLDGELARPEISILRIPVPALGPLRFLEKQFAPRDQIPDSDITPTLVYSGSRAGTMAALIKLNVGRGTPGDSLNARSLFGRCYHSCSGERTKLSRIQDYSDNKFAVVSCTSALGLGQNWTKLKQVIQIGRAGVPESAQVVGRVGQSKQPGLAIIYVEETRRGGRNCLADFDKLDPKTMTDDDLMDALAITPICLQVALVLGNT